MARHKPKGHKRGCACVVCGRGRRGKRAAARRGAGKPVGHKRGCACVVCSYKRAPKPRANPRVSQAAAVKVKASRSLATSPKPNPRVRGFYAAAPSARGVCAKLALNERETAAWRKMNLALRNRVLHHAQRVSRANGRKTVVIVAASGRELERFRA